MKPICGTKEGPIILQQTRIFKEKRKTVTEKRHLHDKYSPTYTLAKLE